MEKRYLYINQEVVKRYLNYDEKTGVFTRKVSITNSVKVGDIAGTLSCGYIYISLCGIRYRAHRLAWLYVYGNMPSCEIDHINRNKLDNRIDNLRLCNISQNAHNTKIRSDNHSGIRGVSWSKALKKWHARINVNKKFYHIGYFNNKEDAAREYKRYSQHLMGDFEIPE
ncbi:HNH endonuclease signature motif containing protein [Hafnia paralvei]|uniref:HNH endonuclease signature motif containing protein n=1 Tax=Hafnia paralvei TaxID=546367 RepID=UPI0024BA7DE4|nr:HNH endonuclease signature motif containing protein [Hafnia paralvei]